MRQNGWIIANSTLEGKGKGEPTHYGKGDPSTIDLAIIRERQLKNIRGTKVGSRLEWSDHCVINLDIKVRKGPPAEKIKKLEKKRGINWKELFMDEKLTKDF